MDPVANVTLARFAFEDCSNQGGVFSIPRATATTLLPPGFEPVASTNDPHGAGAVVYAIIVTCQSGSINGTVVQAVTFAYAELAVVPPSEFQVEGITDCTMPIAFISSHPEFGALAAWLRLGLSGTGDHGLQEARTNGAGAVLQTMRMGDATLGFVVGEGAPDTLGVGGGEFILYGVQGQQVTSIVKGTAAGGNAHYAPINAEISGVTGLDDMTPVALGFAANGFCLEFEQRPLPVA